MILGQEPVVSLPNPSRHSRAISVGTTPMIAIPVADFMRPVAVIVASEPQPSCNNFGHNPPMIAIPPSDDCSSVQLTSLTTRCATIVAMNTFLDGTIVTASISGTTLTLGLGSGTTSAGAIGYPVTGLGSTLILSDTVITGVISSTQYTVSQPQTVASEAMRIGGDMLDVRGPGSGTRSMGFDVQQTPAQVASGDTPFRTGGYTVNLLDNNQFVEDFFMSSCFICIRMGAGGGKEVVRNGIMQFIADGTSNPGSGGVLVDNTGPGPENYIENTYIYPNLPGLGGGPTLYQPTFGHKIVNSGATHLRSNDVTQAKYDLWIAPGHGQTVQATKSSDDVFDAAGTSCVYIAPTDTGYVFDTTFISPWCTSQVSGINGVVVAGSLATAQTAQPYPVMSKRGKSVGKPHFFLAPIRRRRVFASCAATLHPFDAEPSRS